MKKHLQPVTALGYTNEDIVIEDDDGDGFFTWGMGERPSTCPSWVYDLQDGDDANDTITYINEYGKTYPFERQETLEINSADTLHGRNFGFGDIVIKCNKSLTIKESLCMLGKTRVYIEPNATLCVDGGTFSHANIKMDTNSGFTIKNGGKIYIPKDEDFSVPIGASLFIQEGEICKPFVKKQLFTIDL